MLKIGICDDEEKAILIIYKKVIEKLEKRKFPYQPIKMYTKGMQLLQDLSKEKFDLIFLDIDMPEIDGISIAKKIQEEEKQTKIIFVTNREDLVYYSFAYSPFWYIPKNMIHSILNDALEAFCKIKESCYHSVFLEKQKICIHDILYLEKEGHYIKIIGDGKEKQIRMSLSVAEQILEPYYFIRCHVGYLINPEYIFAIEAEFVILENNKKISISRRKQQETKEKFALYMKGH